MSIGERIDDLIFERNISQRQMANDLHISASTLNNYIRDYREPDIDTLKRIASYFGVSMDYLLDYQPPSDEPERELLGAFNRLKAAQRSLVTDIAKRLAEMNGAGAGR